MKILKTLVSLLVLVIWLLMSPSLLALPTFQVASPADGTPGDWVGGDEDSWLVESSTFELVVVGAFQAYGSEGEKETESLSQVTLCLSMPQGLTGGSITIEDAEGNILTPLTTRTPAADGYFNPNADATLDILEGDSVIDGYPDKDGEFGFLPEGVSFNEHYPFKEDVSDFIIYGLGEFEDLDLVHNYNADTDDPDFELPSPLTGNYGEEKTYTVTITDFEWVHFDAYGYVTYVDGTTVMESTWDISVASHDTTYIPAPGAILLGSIGVCLVGWLRRRRTL